MDTGAFTAQDTVRTSRSPVVTDILPIDKNPSTILFHISVLIENYYDMIPHSE